MIDAEIQKQVLDAIKAMTHGMSADDKRAAQERLLAGVVIALDALDCCPPYWKAMMLVGRAHKLFGRTYGSKE
jgi:hypothetical protein